MGSSPSNRIGLGRLLVDIDWLRTQAGELVVDPHRADDLSQEACVVALTRPPADPRNPRGWLTRVMRNLLYQNRRSERRRLAREAEVARPESLVASEEEAGRNEALHGLVALLSELEEPFRTVVFLRYFEGLTPSELARSLGVPEATVRSRLRRGLARLRQRLERRQRDERRTRDFPRSTAARPEEQGRARFLARFLVWGTAASGLVAAGLWFLVPSRENGAGPGTSAGATHSSELLSLESGDWECRWEFLDADGNIRDTVSGIEHTRLDPETRVLESSTEIPEQGRHLRGLKFLDVARQRLVFVEVDEQGELWILEQGDEPEQLVSWPHRTPEGAFVRVRVTTLVRENDRREVLTEESRDGGETWTQISVETLRRAGP